MACARHAPSGDCGAGDRIWRVLHGILPEVDTWQGDQHTGHYGEQVYQEFRTFHEERYRAFSTLLRCTFDDALQRIADGSVDLLHIDGLHTYEAVHHDFESWRPKLSPRAVVLFHDINVHWDDFGVWRVWQQLTAEYPHFHFNHCYGLGVLAVGGDVPPAVAALCALNATDEGAAFRDRVALIGERWMADAREHDLNRRLATESGARGAAEAATATAQAELAAAQAQTAQRDAIIGQLRADAAERTSQQDARAGQLRAEAAERSRTIHQLQSRAAAADATIADLRQRLDAIEQSTTWRATAGVRAMAERLPKPVRRNLRRAARAAYWVLIRHRIPSRLRFLRDQHHPWAAGAALDLISRRYADIRADIKARLAAAKPLGPQREATSDGPLISIMLPVFRPPLPLIEKTISSVLRQSYPHWELCIVDDGSQQPQLAQRLQHYAANDRRIKLRISEANAGIAAASNLALSLATGSHVAFLDHDDLLTCDALECIARVIADEPNVDVIYSDECKIDEQDEPQDIFSKPDWSPALMLNCMYIGHLVAYRRSLITTLGGLRSDYDFAQDYDLALRASDKAVNVRHVDRVLYCWRMTEQSGAAGGKPYARQSNIAALQDALARRSYDARAVALPTVNHACWTREALRGRVSIIIPSDNFGHVTQCVQSIRKGTTYADYELVVVTGSAISRDLAELGKGAGVRFVDYDKPFNFSDKCNAGAAAASGEYLVFLNDDVRVITGEWIEALLECLRIDGVGASSPKLLYEDDTIQHAGLVTGVRGLVGTAFHCLPADTRAHFNFAQSLRETSAISAACLAMRRDLFFKLGAFDAAHVPINHSDIDLCFRLREEGYRCLYTPHATLRHIGHQSLAAHDAGNGGATRRAKDKADIYLLRRWPEMVAYDPYFPPAMRDLLYADSPEDYKIYPAGSKRGSGGLDIVILSHDLTNSGAPRLVFDMAKVLAELGHFVVVMSPTDGPYRVTLVSLGITVIIDSLLLKGHNRFPIFARNFDRVIVNTAVMLPAVRQLSRQTDVYWYIHESRFVADQFSHQPDFVQALHEARAVWAASKRAHRFLRGMREDVDLLEYGVDPPPGASRIEAGGDRPVMFAVIGSYEPRKGQDLAIKGIRLLPKAIRRECRFDFFGRVLDSPHHAALRAMAADIPEVHLGPELSHDECLGAIREADIILSPSRDDTLPLVSLDTLAAGKILMCTAETGTSEYLKHMQSFIRIDDPSPEAVCAAITAAFEARAQWSEIAERGHQVFVQEFSTDAFVKRLTRCLELTQPDVDPGFGLAENRTRVRVS